MIALIAFGFLSDPAFYVVVAAFGFIMLIVSLLTDDLFEIDGVFDFDVEWLSTKVIAAALVGFGTIGWLAVEYAVPLAVIIILAGTGAILMGLVSYHLIVKPLLGQEGNITLSRASYVGRSGQVLVAILQDGWGVIRITDNNGALVELKAKEADGKHLPTGSQIIVTHVSDDSVTVIPNPLD